MKIVSYNIHYAIGKDSRYDLARIVETVAGADIIGLQEVERNYGPPGGPLQPEEIAALLPDYYWVFDAAFDIDDSERHQDGTILNRRCQHGQMLLSRWPILSKRYFPLPRLDIDYQFNMQMGVLEGVLETPLGALRVYVLHLGSVSGEEREHQANFLLARVRDAPGEGGAWTGPACDDIDKDWSAGKAKPPMPENAIVLGDFNMEVDSVEYKIFATAKDRGGQMLLTDIWARQNPNVDVKTWYPNPGRPGNEAPARLDYCFLTQGLVDRAVSSWVYEAAIGSDHQPLWVELED